MAKISMIERQKKREALVAKYAAIALCGGDVETGSLVDEDWLLTVERKLFIDLLKNEKTQQRIIYTLENGKPLRN